MPEISTPTEPVAESERTAGDASKPAKESDWGATIFTSLLFYGMAVFFVFNLSAETSEKPIGELIARFWWATLILPAIAGIASLFEPSRRALKTAAPTTRAGLFIFVIVGSLFIVVGGTYFMPPDRRVMLFRSIFLVVVCILPAIMWYLFIATRKASLLNEFVAKLDRLGLLHTQKKPGYGQTRRRLPVSRVIFKNLKPCTATFRIKFTRI